MKASPPPRACARRDFTVAPALLIIKAVILVKVDSAPLATIVLLGHRTPFLVLRGRMAMSPVLVMRLRVLLVHLANIVLLKV